MEIRVREGADSPAPPGIRRVGEGSPALVIPVAVGVPKIAIAVNAPSRANVGDTQLETGLRHDSASGNRFDGDLIAAKPTARYRGGDPPDPDIRTFLSTSSRIWASVFVCSDRWAGNEGTSR